MHRCEYQKGSEDMEADDSLEMYRRNIDDIDDKLVALLKERFALSTRIADYKQAYALPVLDSGREQRIIERIRYLCGEQPCTDRIVGLYGALMRESRILQRKLSGNYYLIGMPGCGKSTVGRELALKLGRTFIDADDFFEELNGQTPADIIGTFGEQSFRRKESEVLQSITGSSHSVVALGGGVVTVPENRAILGEDCLIIYVRRPLDKLELEGRPLSLQKGVWELYDTRHELYEAWADVTADNDGEALQTVDRILEML